METQPTQRQTWLYNMMSGFVTECIISMVERLYNRYGVTQLIKPSFLVSELVPLAQSDFNIMAISLQDRTDIKLLKTFVPMVNISLAKGTTNQLHLTSLFDIDEHYEWPQLPDGEHSHYHDILMNVVMLTLTCFRNIEFHMIVEQSVRHLQSVSTSIVRGVDRVKRHILARVRQEVATILSQQRGLAASLTSCDHEHELLSPTDKAFTFSVEPAPDVRLVRQVPDVGEMSIDVAPTRTADA